MNPTRWLIVNADELGRSAGINRGIALAHERGVVSSASAMVRRPAAEGAAEVARRYPDLSVGLHVDLGEWICRDGRWTEVEQAVNLEDADDVEQEVLHQLERFHALFGRNPTHLDSHQSVHRSGHAMAILAAHARRLRIPLRYFTPGIRVCSEFYGQTSRGEPYPQGIAVERLLWVLARLGPGTTELVCHPAERPDAGGSYEEERGLELQALTDPRVRAGMESREIRLRSFFGVGLRPREGEIGLRQMEASLRKQGQAAFRRGEFRRAQKCFGEAVVVGGDLPWPWLWLARAQLGLGDLAGSRRSIQQALTLDPGWPMGLLHLTDLHLEAGRWGEAGELLLELAGRNGTAGQDLPERIARRIRRLEDPRWALDVAEALTANHPGDGRAGAARAIALWQAGDRTAARHLVDSLCQRKDPPSLRGAAEFHLEVGEPRAAWELLRGVPDRDLAPRLVSQVAQGLRRAGDLTHSWEAFERALARGDRDSSVRHWRDVVVGEIQVLSGSYTPCAPVLRHYRPTPGRILHVVGRSLPWLQTGYAVRTRYVTGCQQEMGWDPHVVTQLGFPWTEGTDEAPLWEEVDGIPHHRLSGPTPLPERLDDRLDLNVRELLALVRRVRPAAIHAASDYRNALLALAVGRACGIPIIYEVRGFWEDTWSSKQESDRAEDSVAYRWRRDRELECMRRADRVVTLAEVMRDELAARGIPKEKIAVVPNAVDPAAFQPAVRNPRLSRELGIRDGEVVVGYVSSFVAYEGIRTLIEAVGILASRGLPVRGLLVGDGQDRAALESRVRELGLSDRVIFTGRVPHGDVASYYGLIDAFVVPRTNDRVCRLVTPLKPYEAMAMERAVVVSGVTALEEMVISGKTGLTFRPEDAHDLADVVEPLVRSPELRHTMGAAARQWVSRHRTWVQNGERYTKLYEELGLQTPSMKPNSCTQDRGPTARRTAVGAAAFGGSTSRGVQ